MHSNIYQVSLIPIDVEDYANVDLITENSNVFNGIDYASEIKDIDERKDAIERLITNLDGLFELSPDSQSMTYKGGIEEWKKKLVKRIREESDVLTEKNIFGIATYYIQDTIKNCVGSYLFVFGLDDYAVDSCDFMQWVNDLSVGDKVYFGCVMDYHF